MKKNKTYIVCCISNTLQSIGIIFPLIFVALKTLYNITFSQFGILISCNFFFQLLSDLFFSKLIDKYGFKPFAVISPILTSFSLVFFALSPYIFPSSEFIGFLIGITIFAIAAGLQELLLSPIVDSIDFDKKIKVKKMSLMHSFFAWGKLILIPLISFLLYKFGLNSWNKIMLFLAILPLISSILFFIVPLNQKHHENNILKTNQLLKNKVFLFLVLTIIFAGATEVTMEQWTSIYLEKGLNIPKHIGDILGVCGFSFFIALGRTLYGYFGEKFNIHHTMIIGSFLSILTYIGASITNYPIIGIFCCAFTGFTSSLLWPGTIAVSSKLIPTAGASLFAFLSASGDIGASLSNFIMGKLTDLISFSNLTFLQNFYSKEQASLKLALLISAIFPIFSLLCHLKLNKDIIKKLNN